MVDILDSNFEFYYPKIVKSIESSSFISIDAEFSGLVVSEEYGNSIFDSCDERYEKLKKNFQSFKILQLGLSTYKYFRQKNEYEVMVYRFYLSPRSFSTVIDREFLIDPASVEFLSNQGFDFNKCEYEGISYMRQDEEKLLKDHLKKTSLFDCLINSVSCENMSIIENACDLISNWYEIASINQTISVEAKWKGRMQHLVLYYVLIMIIKKYHQCVSVTIGQHEIIVKKTDNAFSVKEERNLENSVINSYVGFSKIFRVIANSKKPIVGHNMLSDLLFMYCHFYKPLPDKYKTLKKEFTSFYGSVYDTKYISYELRSKLSKEEKWNSNDLDGLYEYFTNGQGSKLVYFSPKMKLSNQVNITKIHDAAYDSFVTGYCFIKMAHILAVRQRGADWVPTTTITFTMHLAIMEPYKNRLNLIKAHTQHINLEGEDPVSKRPLFLYVKTNDGSDINVKFLKKLLSLRSESGELKKYSNNSVFIAAGRKNEFEKLFRELKLMGEYEVSCLENLHPRSLPQVMRKVVVPCGILLTSSIIIGLFVFKRYR